MENRPLAELLAALADVDRLWLRGALTRTVSEWQLAVVEITSGEAPPSWQTAVWRYETVLFAAAEVRGADVAECLEKQRLSLASIEVALGGLPTQVQVERRESNFAGVFEPLPWPSVVWSGRLGDPYMQQPPGELVGDGLRAFLDFDQAAAAFFGVSPAINRNFSGREFVYRLQDLRARIDAVRIRPTEIVTTLSGRALKGATLTVGGDRDVPSAALASDMREVHLPLAEPLAARAWLALHRDRELLDKRYLGAGWAQIRVEVELDAATELAALVTAGEGPTTEFKRELPDSDPRAIRTAIKSVAAFANGHGGTIVYGVDDEGAVLGLGDGSLRAAVDRLTNIVSDYVRPLPSFDVRAITEPGVVLVRVDPGPDTPYGVGTSDRDVIYYIRRGATTFPAAPNDIRQMVRAREPTPDPLAHVRFR